MPKRHEKKGVPRKEKRCIPKEGMPHVHKTYQKMGEEKNIIIINIYSPCPRKINIYEERDRSSNGVHPLTTKKIFHTLAPLDQVV